MEEIERYFADKSIHDFDPAIFGSSDQTPAAVLILLVYFREKWNILFTRRTSKVRTHQGEVSFPGGSYEQEDRALLKTALRETWEEIGISPDCIKILGELNPYKTISNFLVYPFVGKLTCELNFDMQSDEVERVFLIPVDWLKDKAHFYEDEYTLDGHTFRKVIHYKDYDGEHLWGLTARITQEILSLR
jgi:8-oxo-dGTP pyrophosphatase MutT (NUDIX family)